MAEHYLEVSRDLEEHFSGKRIGTSTTVLEILRRHHRGYHVTEISAYNIALLDFADAGHAQYTPVAGVIPNCVRKWFPDDASPRGVLVDIINYACFWYVWNGANYVVYRVDWKDTNEAMNKSFYIVKERGGDLTGIHCKETDDLISEAGAWTLKPHNEVLVYEEGYWDKDKDMYKSVQDAKWDDVSLVDFGDHCKH